MSQAQPIEEITVEELQEQIQNEYQIENQLEGNYDAMMKSNYKDFDWVRYKTEKCNDKECILQAKRKDTVFPLYFECEKWHNVNDKRRPIIMKDKNKFNYSRLYIKSGEKEDTRYCMNFFEYLYHPQNFRSKECPSVQQITSSVNIEINPNQKDKIPCVYGFYCPYFHSQQEKNDWVNDLKSTKYMAAPKEKFTQSLLDDFNNIQSSNKQLEKLFEQTNAGKQQQDKNNIDRIQKGNSIDVYNNQSKIESPTNDINNLTESKMNIFNQGNLEFRKLLNTDSLPFAAQLESTDCISSKKDININDSYYEPNDKPSRKGSRQYSPKSKTMTNLEHKDNSNSKTKGGNTTQNIDPNKEINQQLISNGDSSIKNIKQEKIKNKRIEQIMYEPKVKSSNSLNINENRSIQDLDVTKQMSKYTDLSSNDEYLKDISDSNNQRSKYTYNYRQDMGHESSTIEFKNYQKLSSCKIQKDMNGILKLQEYGQYICGFLNHKGGTMYIGVHDEGWVDGIGLNAKQKDWFNQNIDYVTSQIEPRLVVGEVRINYVEVVGKSNQNLPKDSKNYVIELQVVKTNYSDIYFYENNAFVKKQSSLTKMSMGEIKQDLLVKIKKQQKAESNFIQKLVIQYLNKCIQFMYDDTTELDTFSTLQLQKLEEKLSSILKCVQNKLTEKRAEV